MDFNTKMKITDIALWISSGLTIIGSIVLLIIAILI
jgi:hypothetical protein